jgi:predicted RND superfamily exporter protein
MFAHIGARNIESMLKGTILALLLISLILGLALKSFKFGLISLIPNLVPAAVAFGIWGFWVGEVGLALSVVMGMTLGIIVDDTVHFLSKYQHARKEGGAEPEKAVLYAFSSVGQALWVTTLVLASGFGILAFSDFAANGRMGLLTAVTIVIALVVDLLLLPALLLLIDRTYIDENSHKSRDKRAKL